MHNGRLGHARRSLEERFTRRWCQTWGSMFVLQCVRPAAWALWSLQLQRTVWTKQQSHKLRSPDFSFIGVVAHVLHTHTLPYRLTLIQPCNLKAGNSANESIQWFRKELACYIRPRLCLVLFFLGCTREPGCYSKVQQNYCIYITDAPCIRH